MFLWKTAEISLTSTTSCERLRHTIEFQFWIYVVFKTCFHHLWAQCFHVLDPKAAASSPTPSLKSSNVARLLVRATASQRPWVPGLSTRRCVRSWRPQIRLSGVFLPVITSLWWHICVRRTGRCGGVMAYPDSCQLERSGICWDMIENSLWQLQIVPQRFLLHLWQPFRWRYIFNITNSVIIQ